MTILLFCLNGLDLISDIEEVIPEATRKSCIEWIYSQQVIPRNDGGMAASLTLVRKIYEASPDTAPVHGFRGGPRLITSVKGEVIEEEGFSTLYFSF